MLIKFGSLYKIHLVEPCKFVDFQKFELFRQIVLTMRAVLSIIFL